MAQKGQKMNKNNQQKRNIMQKVKVFENAALLKSLAAHLEGTAEKVTAAGDAMRQHFPALPWNNQILWILTFEPDARHFLCRLILERAAEAANMPCAWDIEETPAPAFKPDYFAAKERQTIDEETRLNRKLVELQTRDARAPFLALDGLAHIGTYLRTGALSIGKKGETITAPDAAERLADFCTLYAETPKQAAFVEGLEKMQRAALDLESAYKDALNATPAGRERTALARLAWQYATPARFGLTQNDEGFFSIFAKDAAARALITIFRLTGDKGAPKFYNLAGLPKPYTKEDAAKLIGCKPGQFKGLRMRTEYPALYARTIDGRALGLNFYPEITGAEG